MKNGLYILILAPIEYTGVKYRGKYCYEHHLIWWKNTGEVISNKYVIHHKNGNKCDNRFENLDKILLKDHVHLHRYIKDKTSFKHGTWSSYKRKNCRCEICLKWWSNFKIYSAEYRRTMRS